MPNNVDPIIKAIGIVFGGYLDEAVQEEREQAVLAHVRNQKHNSTLCALCSATPTDAGKEPLECDCCKKESTTWQLGTDPFGRKHILCTRCHIKNCTSFRRYCK